MPPRAPASLLESGPLPPSTCIVTPRRPSWKSWPRADLHNRRAADLAFEVPFGAHRLGRSSTSPVPGECTRRRGARRSRCTLGQLGATPCRLPSRVPLAGTQPAQSRTGLQRPKAAGALGGGAKPLIRSVGLPQRPFAQSVATRWSRRDRAAEEPALHNGEDRLMRRRPGANRRATPIPRPRSPRRAGDLPETGIRGVFESLGPRGSAPTSPPLAPGAITASSTREPLASRGSSDRGTRVQATRVPRSI